MEYEMKKGYEWIKNLLDNKYSHFLVSKNGKEVYATKSRKKPENFTDDEEFDVYGLDSNDRNCFPRGVFIKLNK